MSAALIYSVTTGRLRRVVVPAEGAAVGPGEALLAVSDAEYSSMDAQALVNQATGIAPADDRYAAVADDGFVAAILLADPVGCGDHLPGFALIKHARAAPRWFLESDGRWTPPPQPKRRRKPGGL